MHLALLTSPAAGGGAAARIAGTVASILRGYGHTVDPLVGADADEAARAAQVAAATMSDAVVVLGGDGLAHLALQAVAHTDTALGVIPAGSGNDLARALGMPEDPVSAAHAVANASSTSMDLGRISGGRWFATVACTGFDAEVSERANQLRWPSGPRRYDLAILTTLAAFRARPVSVETETTSLHAEATLVAVGNTSCYGGGIPVCPDADPHDGMLDITVVGACARTELLRMLPSLRSGRHINHPAVTTLRARTVHLGGQVGWSCYADGEAQPRLPLTVRAEPAALTVLTPDTPTIYR